MQCAHRSHCTQSFDEGVQCKLKGLDLKSTIHCNILTCVMANRNESLEAILVNRHSY